MKEINENIFKALYLRGNQLEKLDTNELQGFENLQGTLISLKIIEKDIDGNTFKGFGKLQTLYLNKNKLKAINYIQIKSNISETSSA